MFAWIPHGPTDPSIHFGDRGARKATKTEKRKSLFWYILILFWLCRNSTCLKGLRADLQRRRNWTCSAIKQEAVRHHTRLETMRIGCSSRNMPGTASKQEAVLFAPVLPIVVLTCATAFENVWKKVRSASFRWSWLGARWPLLFGRQLSRQGGVQLGMGQGCFKIVGQCWTWISHSKGFQEEFKTGGFIHLWNSSIASWKGRHAMGQACNNLTTCMGLFPRASERRVLPIVGVCISSSHLHTFSSSHLLIFTSSHPHIFTSSPLALLPSCPSCPLALLPSCPLLLFYFSSEGGGRGSANETARNATLSHETRFDRQKLR